MSLSCNISRVFCFPTVELCFALKLLTMARIPELVMPGDDATPIINEILQSEGAKYVVGPGLLRDTKRTKAVAVGFLQMREKPNVFWVQSHQRRVCWKETRFLSCN